MKSRWLPLILICCLAPPLWSGDTKKQDKQQPAAKAGMTGAKPV